MQTSSGSVRNVKLFRGCSGDIVSSNENNFVSSDTAATLLFQKMFLHIIQYIFKDIIDIIYLTVTPLTLVEGSTCPVVAFST